jgi:hypothetical protein
MYELLLRTETYFLGLEPIVLLGGGFVAALIGLCLWLIGAHYSTLILGLLGALIGSLSGMLAGKWLGVDLWLAMAIGAVVLGIISVLLRNILIIVLATLIFAGVSGTGYLAVQFDSQTPATPPETTEEARTEPSLTPPKLPPFATMNQMDRLAYVDRIAGDMDDSSGKLSALLQDTWAGLGPNKGKFLVSVLGGGLVGLLLVWFVRKVVLMLAYSIVGTATTLMGVQSVLLGLGFKAVSALDTRQWILPTIFFAMIMLGWLCQLIGSRSSHAKKAQKTDDPDTAPSPKPRKKRRHDKWHTTFNR